MRPTRDELMDNGFTWDEAQELLERYAEEQRDAERDRMLEEKICNKPGE